MLFKDGLMYIFGGYGGSEAKKCTQKVEVYNPNSNECTEVGTLKHCNILNKDKHINKLVCCTVDGEDYIVVCGAYSDDQHDKYKQTVQLFSVSDKKTVHSLTLQVNANYAVYGVLPVGNYTFVVIARDYTVVCPVDTIRKGSFSNWKVSDKYIVPNKRCGIMMSCDRRYIFLVGGVPKVSQPKHFLYRASAIDVAQNQGSGWEKIHTLPLGLSKISCFSAVKVDLKF